jgi:hypothetical protein
VAPAGYQQRHRDQHVYHTKQHNTNQHGHRDDEVANKHLNNKKRDAYKHELLSYDSHKCDAHQQRFNDEQKPE